MTAKTNSHDVICRRESKYLVPEAMVPAITRAIAGICSPDERAGRDGRYVVNNVYLDTDDLRFYYDTKHKRTNRFKPRVRYYGAEPDGSLWLELKHKVNNVTWKVRRRADVSEWPNVITDGSRLGRGDAQLTIANCFEEAVSRFRARPVIHVQYVREPYVSEIDTYGRITFDRQLSFRPLHSSPDLAATNDGIYYDDPVTSLCSSDDSPVVLEIKSETEVPGWMIALVQRFELVQRGFSKYCYGIDNLFERTSTSWRSCAVVP